MPGGGAGAGPTYAGAVSTRRTALATTVLAGCRTPPTLRAREAVVQFGPGATAADYTRVRALCPSMHNVTLEPPTTRTDPASRLYGVRYRIDNASDADLAKLYACLLKEPAVRGVDIPSADG